MAGRNHKGQQLPWREDPAYIARMEEIANLRAEGRALPTVAKLLGLATSSVYEHWNHWLELTSEHAESKAAEHIANQEALKRRIIAELADASKSSLNRSALIAQLGQVEMFIAKLDGSLIERKEVKGEITNLLDFVKQVAE